MKLNWKQEILLNDSFIFDENQILKGVVKSSLSNQFHEKMPNGAALRTLNDNKYHQINWETPYYEKVILNFVKGIDKKKPIIDIGCGDGRFTNFLITQGFEKIVCLDSDYRLLESLHIHSTEKKYRDKLFIIHSDADELHFKNKVFSLTLAIGVLYYLNEKEPLTLNKISLLLESEGLLILSEPDIEGMIFRALFFDSLESAIEIFDKRIFKEGKNNIDFKFGIKSESEQMNFINKAGFEVIDNHGITMFHNFLRILLVRGLVSEDQIATNENKIKSLFDFLHSEGKLSKHIIWKCKKR